MGSDTLALTAGTVVNRGDASVIGGKVASVTSNGALTNEGEVTSIDALALEVHGSITNDGRIVATEGSVVLNADGTVSIPATIAGGALTLTAAALGTVLRPDSAATPRPSASAAIWTMQASSTRRCSRCERGCLPERAARCGRCGRRRAGRPASLKSDLTNSGILQSGIRPHSRPRRGALERRHHRGRGRDHAHACAMTNADKVTAGRDLDIAAASYSGAATSLLNALNIDLALADDFANAGTVEALDTLASWSTRSTIRSVARWLPVSRRSPPARAS